MVPWRPEPPAIGIQDVENVRHVASNQSVQSIISLNSELPEQLLRAVPLDICLQRWGLHFNKAERTQGFKLSETTEAIDAFLSHDWDTPGIGKFLALLLVFNAMPAFFGAAVVLVVLCGLLAVKMLPGGWPTATACIYIVFVVILLFWQRLRRVLSLCQMGVVPRVFLDKLCIAQHDDQLKRQGILGLGGFLSKSHELLILWSPKTFTRLWCTFELACFMREKKRRHIRFVPVSMAKLLFLAGTTNLCLWLLWLLWVIVEADGAFGTRHFELLAVAAAFLAPAFLGGVAVQTYFGIQHMEDFLSLDGQLRSFSVRAAQCACCTFGHRHPTTGDPILCDREQIFATLKRWYGTDMPEQHLEQFDLLVRNQLAFAVQTAMGSGTPHLKYVIALLGIPPVTLVPPYLYMGINKIAVNMWDLEWWSLGQWMCMAIHIPAIAFLIFWLSMFSWKLATPLRFLGLRGRVAALTIMQLLALACVWLPFAYASFPKEPGRLIPATVGLWILVLAAYSWTYFRCAKHHLGPATA